MFQDAAMSPQRPVPIIPGPTACQLAGVKMQDENGKPTNMVLLEVYTAQGSSFAFFTPDETEELCNNGLQLVRTMKSGLYVPEAARVIRPLNGDGPL